MSFLGSKWRKLTKPGKKYPTDVNSLNGMMNHFGNFMGVGDNFSPQQKADNMMKSAALSLMGGTESLMGNATTVQKPTEFLDEGEVNPNHLNHADELRNNLHSGQHVQMSDDVHALMPSAKNAYSLVREMGDDKFLQLTGVTKQQADEMMYNDPARFVELFGS